MLFRRVAVGFFKLNCVLFFLLCCSGPTNSEKSRLDSSRSRVLPKIFYQLQKREDFQGYFEQCRFVNSWNRQLGYVNVFAFLNLAWTYSYRQAIMLRILKKRLENAGFSDIWFFVIMAPEDLPADKVEDQIEIETWKKIHEFDSHDILSSAEVVLNDMESEIEDDIIFIQDSADLEIWESFHASRNQIVIVDRCGKLTYQVIVPWSILYFPYVKAAILSTYKEDPCGPCTMHPILRPMDYEEYLFSNESLDHDSNPAASIGDNQENTVFNENSENEGKPAENTLDLERQTNSSATLFNKTDLTENETTTATTARKGPNEETTIYNYSETIDVTGSPTEQTVSATQLDEQEPLVINENVTTSNDSKESVYESTTVDIPPTQGSVSKQDSNTLPIRIIMRVPHLHEESGKYKKYTTVILKTGDPDYHEHYETGEDVPSVITNKGQSNYETGDGFNDPSLLEYIYNRDERPGLYGEVADYWKHYNEDEYTNKNLLDESNTNYADTTNPSEDALNSDTLQNNDSVFKPNAGTDDGSSKSGVINESEDIVHDIVQLNKEDATEHYMDTSTNDDEAKQKLIDHYKKLLPWVYYVL